MIRRSTYFLGVLLFCALAVSCGKSQEVNGAYDGEAAGGVQADTLFAGTNPIDIHIYESGDEAEQETVTNGALKQGNKDADDADTDDKAVQAVNLKDIQEENNLKEDKDLNENESAAEAAVSKDGIKLTALLLEEPDAGRRKDKLDLYPAGTVIDTGGADHGEIASFFYSEEIPDWVKSRITGKSYGEKCDVPMEELRYVRVLYIGFDKLTHIGELIVNRAIAQDITDIFKELYEEKYPIERMVLVDDYGADDITSMEADNTSAFNYRVIDRTTRLSNHSYGLAIDINPLYNPYVRTIGGETVVLPEDGTKYADRGKECPYYIQKGDPCYLAFTKRGFTWGGDWNTQKDYQHFEKR